MKEFILSKATSVKNQQPEDEVLINAAKILERDLQAYLTEEKTANQIQLTKVTRDELVGDQFQVVQTTADVLEIQANTSLGVMYGALAISREVLGVDDSWYFLDVTPQLRPAVTFPDKTLALPDYQVKYRGWFVNDEVMISRWKDHDSTEYVWERIYETLLRFGGNIIIAGTDKNSHANRKSANNFGLATAHHHAEPLGAQMFARVYPDLEPSYLKYPELFHALWQKSIAEQKDAKVIWSLGFRGQGDRPFWDDDTSRVWTEEAKAEVINQVIKLQYDMVKEVDPNAVCAVNIYGELTKMFNENLLELPKDVIEIWADNGYGKMVSRRQGNDDPRAEILSSENKLGNQRGIYYHVAFHDLQASNFLTKLPNSPAFVSAELSAVRQAKMDTLVLSNTGNIKPHILFLQEVAKSWLSSYQARSNETIFNEYMRYYPSEHQAEIKAVYLELFDCFIQYGEHEDQKAGDELYTYTIRKIIQSILKKDERLEEMEWLAGKGSIGEQVATIKKLISTKQAAWATLYAKAEKLYLTLLPEKELANRYYNDLFLDIATNHFGLEALALTIEAYQKVADEEILEAFLYTYGAKKAIKEVLQARAANPSDKWRDFYQNDVFTNIDLTRRMLDTLLQYLRIVGDNHELYDWERKYLMEKGDAKVMLLSNTHDALSNDYLASKLQWRIGK